MGACEPCRRDQEEGAEEAKARSMKSGLLGSGGLSTYPARPGEMVGKPSVVLSGKGSSPGCTWVAETSFTQEAKGVKRSREVRHKRGE